MEIAIFVGVLVNTYLLWGLKRYNDGVTTIQLNAEEMTDFIVKPKRKRGRPRKR